MAGTAASAAACATIPDLGPVAPPKAAETYATDQSFRTGPAAEWPADDWWTVYGDPQLDTLIDEALAGSPDLVQAEARVRTAEAFAQQAGAALLPQLGAQGSLGAVKQSYNMGVPREIAPQGWNDFGSFAGALDWQLDFFGRNRALLAAATSNAEAARADSAAARLALSTAVASAYGDLAKLHADHDAASEAVRVRTESEALISKRAAQGLETEAALERARSGRAAAEARLEAVDEAIALTRNGVAALLGQGPDRGLSIDRPRPGAIRALGLPENLEADLVGRRPDIVAARLTAEAAAQRIKAAKADFYPNVNLSAVIGEQSLSIDKLAKSGSMFGAIGPAISLPIFSAGRLEGAYRGAFADYQAAVALYDSTVVRAFREVADSAVSIDALGARLAKSREAHAASERAYALMRLRYDRGLATYLDVLSAEDALIDNRRAVAELETRAFILDVALIRSLGGGYRG
jgi:NodT family efflux transporter outer membrane factor (OMF) lipoprotein